MRRNTKRGFLSLEAALFVPIFVVSVLTFGYLIKAAIAEESIMNIMAEEARKISLYSYNIKAEPVYAIGLQARLIDKNKEIGDAYIETFRYLYKHSGKEDLIGIRVSSNVRIKLPIVFHDSVDVSNTIFFRAFTGKEFKSDDHDFDDMGKEEESKIVWVFPIAGEKYHEIDCGYINVAAKQATLNSAILKKYKPCAHCEAKGLSLGSVVYYFASSGEAYHTGSCFIVDRYVIPIEEEDAIKIGYTPCSKCIGSKGK